jgi:hypothetical protein
MSALARSFRIPLDNVRNGQSLVVSKLDSIGVMIKISAMRPLEVIILNPDQLLLTFSQQADADDASGED